MTRFDRPTLQALYDILVREAGADAGERAREVFVLTAIEWPDRLPFEYRFCGTLGFGGKVWLHDLKAPYVTCYRENETPEREKTISRTNRALAAVVGEDGGAE